MVYPFCNLDITAGYMAQLNRVVLIDSINRGSNIEVQLCSNAALTGTNGIGKTSFLKLIPIFFGARPGQLVRSDGNNKNFADWYLPNDSSYIVYEYENYAGGQCCVVLHRSGNAYSYRFVSGPWIPALVYEDAETGLLAKPGALIGHITAQGRSCSPEINQTAYRLAILYNTGTNDLQGIEDARQRTLIQHNRRLFSLAPKGQDVSGIDSMTLTLIESGSNYDGLRTVVADILRQTCEDPTEALATLSLHNFQQVLNSYEGYKLFEKEAIRRIGELGDLYDSYAAKTNQLGTIKGQAIKIREQACSERALAEDALSELEDDAEQHKSESDRSQGEIFKRRGEAYAAFEKASRTLNALENDRKRFDDSGMDELVILCGRKPAISAERDAKMAELDQLDKAGADVRLRYERLINDTRQRYQALIDAQREKEGPLRADCEADIARIRDTFDADFNRLERESEAATAPLRARLDAIRIEAGNAGADLAVTRKLKVLPDDQTHIDEARAALDARNQDRDQTASEIAAIDGEMRQWADDQKRLADEQSGVDRRRKQIIEQRDALKAQLDAKESTLLGFLRRHHPDWTDNIGRLIPPHILMRDDLNPQLVDLNGQRSLFGVSLKLSSLSPQPLASTDDLRQDIAGCESELQNAEQDESDIANRSAKHRERKRDLDTRQQTWKQDAARIAESIAGLRSQIEGLNERARENHTSYCMELEERIKTLDADTLQTQQWLRDTEAEMGRQGMQLRVTRDGAIDNLKERLDGALALITQEVIELTAQRDREVQELNRNMESALTDAGVDTAIRNRLECAIDELTGQLRRIDACAAEVDTYTRWLRDSWSRLAELQRDNDIAEQEKTNADREFKEFLDSDKRWRNEMNAKRDALRKRITANENIKHRADLLLEGTLEGISADLEAVLMPGQTVDDIDHEARLLLRQQNDIGRRGSTLYGQITGLYLDRGLQHSPHAGQLNMIALESRKEADSPGSAWQHGANLLRTTMLEYHAEQRKKLIMRAESLGQTVLSSRGHLHELHKAIGRLDKLATERAAQVAQSFSSLQVESVKIQSRIQVFDFWKDLEYFEQQFNRWRGAGDDQLPSEGYIQAVSAMERLLKQNKLSASLIDCFSLEVVLYDSGRQKVITNDASFASSGSTGIKVLLQCMLFVSLFELLRKDAPLTIIFPVDETLRLSAENYIPLMKALHERGVVTVAGFPDGNPEVLSHFTHSYEFFRDSVNGVLEIRQYLNPEPDELDRMESELRAQETAEA